MHKAVAQCDSMLEALSSDVTQSFSSSWATRQPAAAAAAALCRSASPVDVMLSCSPTPPHPHPHLSNRSSGFLAGSPGEMSHDTLRLFFHQLWVGQGGGGVTCTHIVACIHKRTHSEVS
jgi:hypothetical protein